MHGITHLYRQHALEKQLSADCWQNSGGSNNTAASYARNYLGDGVSINSTSEYGSLKGTGGLSSMDSSTSSSSSSNSKSSNCSQDKVTESLGHASSPQPVPDTHKSITNHYRNSPTHSGARSSYESYGSSFKTTPSSKRNIFDRSHSPAVYSSLRKPNHLDYNNSPPVPAGFFPHDLDDIYESKKDQQYFTYSGSSAHRQERPSINSIFHRVGAAPASLDEYCSGSPLRHSLDSGSSNFPRYRFDNTSFVKSLSINEDEGGNVRTSSPKDHKHKHKDHHHNHHHHHSIQEILKHFGKKVHIWPRKSHDNSASSVCTSPQNDPQENFRMRSKSLDVNTNRPNRILEDCGATYKIFDKIVKEGNSKVYL